MLTLLITANVEQQDLAKKHLEKIQAVSKLEKNIEVVFLVRSDFKQLSEIQYLTVNVQNHFALIADPHTTDDEMVQTGLDFASGNDVLLCTIDTLPSVLVSVLEKRTGDRKIIWVRKKGNLINNFFRKIGNSAYNLGLTMIGKNSDNFSEVRVQYLDSRIAGNLAESIENNRELRMTNSFKQVLSGVVETPQIYESKTKKDWKTNVMLSLGIVTFIYVLALLALAVIYPIFNNMTYSWWMVVIIVAWVLFGVIGIIITSKRIYRRRCGTPLRITEEGAPAYGIIGFLQFGDRILPPVSEEILTKGIIKSNTTINRGFKTKPPQQPAEKAKKKIVAKEIKNKPVKAKNK